MKLSDFTFELPDELIARYPAESRSGSRLLVMNGQTGDIQHRQFSDLLDALNPEDCLIFNNTRVIPARLYGKRDSGGKVELLTERVLDQHQILSQVKASNTLKPGTLIHISEQFAFVVEGRQEQFYLLKTASADYSVMEVLEQQGHIPLPPYIDREDEQFDSERYQTVYAQEAGAVAAPTAGLHFSEDLMQAMADKGVEYDFVTLHVGSGTFAPVRVDNVLEHKMHSEVYEVPQSVADLVAKTKARGGRVVAVGTTSVRCLETASANGALEAACGETDIFIYPGYEFKTVDALLTNFHLPESTLIMLVSAFATKEYTLKAYHEAVEQAYRFFSYGDAMFIEQRNR